MGEGAKEVNNVVCFVDAMVSVTFTAMVMPNRLFVTEWVYLDCLPASGL